MLKLDRNTTPEERDALKAATRHSLKKIVAAKFAPVTRVLPPALSDYGSIAAPGDFMPVDILADMQKEYGHGVASPLLEEIAAQAGFKLVPLDSGDGGEALGFDHVGQMMKEGSEANVASLQVAASPTCLASIRAARKEIQEDIEVKSAAIRKLAQQERRVMGRAG